MPSKDTKYGVPPRCAAVAASFWCPLCRASNLPRATIGGPRTSEPSRGAFHDPRVLPEVEASDEVHLVADEDVPGDDIDTVDARCSCSMGVAVRHAVETRASNDPTPMPDPARITSTLRVYVVPVGAIRRHANTKSGGRAPRRCD
jgi:hypothetical protein